jgi:hypothetical protein
LLLRPSQIPEPMAFHMHSTGSAKVELVPRKSLSTPPPKSCDPRKQHWFFQCHRA